MSEDDRYRLKPAERVGEVMKWLRNRGYIGSFIPAAPESFAHDVVLFGRPGEPAILATVGNVLVWDGETVAVETA